jgi:hypothetical protein
MNTVSRRTVSLFSPFLLENRDHYRYWRDKKLQNYPTSVSDLLVEIDDPSRLTHSEYEALLSRCRKAIWPCTRAAPGLIQIRKSRCRWVAVSVWRV